MTIWMARVLWSINERLAPAKEPAIERGRVAMFVLRISEWLFGRTITPPAIDRGEDVEPLSSDFLEDVLDVLLERAADPEKSKPNMEDLEESLGI